MEDIQRHPVPLDQQTTEVFAVPQGLDARVGDSLVRDEDPAALTVPSPRVAAEDLPANPVSHIAEQFHEDPTDANARRPQWNKRGVSYALAAAGGAIPGIHYLLEDPIFASLQARFASHGPTDIKGALTIVGLTGAMALEGYAFGHVANKVDFIAKKVDALGEKSRNVAVRLGQTALNGIKKPLDYAATGLKKIGDKLGTADRSRANRFIGRQLLDTAAVVALGTPGAVVVEKMQEGDHLAEKRIAKLAALFAATWWPTYEVAKAVVYGTYDGLYGLSNRGMPLAAGADSGAHEVFRAIGSSVDPTKVSGLVVMGGITLSMMAAAVHAEYKNRSQDEDAPGAPLQTDEVPLQS